MAKLLYLDYISLIIYSLIVFTVITKSDSSDKKRGLFCILVFIAVICNIYDICAVLLDNSGPGGVVLKYILHGGYLILHSLIIPAYGAYIVIATDTWHRIRIHDVIKVLLPVPLVLMALLTATSALHHLVYYFDAEDAYVRGPLFILLYICAAFYAVLIVYYLIRYYRVLGSDKFIPLISIVPCQILSAAIQFFRPDILCEMFCTSLCILFVMLTVEKPSGKKDSMTGILKSTAFNDVIISASLVGKPLTLLVINTTNNNAISSYLSPLYTDEIYIHIVNRIKDLLRLHSLPPTIYSLDNGLFAVTLSGTSMSASEVNLPEELAGSLNSSLNADYSVSNYTVSVLVNVAIINMPQDVSDIDSLRILLKNFRSTKYIGDYIKLSDEVNSKNYKIMQNMDKIIKAALEEDMFEIYYQPIYSIKDQKFISAEALIRLHHPDYGFIDPDIFIPYAEDSGSIHEIGMLIFEQVCQFISTDDFKRLGLEYIEVNLSVVQCMDRDLSFKIFGVMDKYNIRPSQLNLEITETASAILQKSLLDNIERLHKEGLSFSLDDFGTGYSNMVRIASLPLNIVKLDRTFTFYENDPGLKVILENTVSMLKKTNMEMVIEGVETSEMFETFKELGVDFVQGFYFSRPLSREKFVEYILSTTPSLQA